MFKDLLVFDKQRSILQAIGFHLAFLVLGGGIAALFALFFADDFAAPDKHRLLGKPE
ncbi:MAG: hypothetical protein ACR2PW_05545 [Gammaproteobacteria bacterium]